MGPRQSLTFEVIPAAETSLQVFHAWKEPPLAFNTFSSPDLLCLGLCSFNLSVCTRATKSLTRPPASDIWEFKQKHFKSKQLSICHLFWKEKLKKKRPACELSQADCKALRDKSQEGDRFSCDASLVQTSDPLKMGRGLPVTHVLFETT